MKLRIANRSELAEGRVPLGRELRKWHQDEVEAVVEAAHEQIAVLRFAGFGTSVYPDATFTLRLSFWLLRGWDGSAVEPFTRLTRLFERATGSRSRCLQAGKP